MSGDWESYMGQLNDAPANFLVDLGMLEQAPVSGASDLLMIQIDLPQPTEEGLPSEADYDFLDDVEESIIESITRQIDGVYVGAVASQGTHTMAFYFAKRDGSEAEVEKAMSGIEGVEWGAQIEADAQWSFYFDVLAPSPEQMRFIGDARLVEQLEEAGDKLAAPRAVEHTAFFETADDRSAFVEAVTPLGFSILRTENDADDDLPFGLEFVREHSVELDTVFGITSQLDELATGHNGMYDGWQTSPVK